MLELNEVLSNFPASKFRRYQREVIEKVVDAFNSGYKCILLEAPTGFGKSYVNTAFARSMYSFYTTPQLSLIKQMLNDPRLIGIYKDIKGRQNYRCYHDPEATVDEGLCVRNRFFECQKEEVCPYWKRKIECLKWNPVLTSFAYFILEGRTEGSPYSLGSRELLIIDEGHSIDRHILNHVTLAITPSLQGIYRAVAHELHEDMSRTDVLNLLHEVYNMCKYELRQIQKTLDGGAIIGIQDAKYRRKLEEWVAIAEMFFESEVKEWVWSLKWATLQGRKYKYLVVQPVYARDYGWEMLWHRAEYYIISSATILNADMFIYETGLDKAVRKSEVLYLKVPSIFPPENRPIVDCTIGKLTVSERDYNIGKAIKKIEEILEKEKGNVAIHCHSYDFAKKVYKFIHPKYKDRLIIHTSEDREEMLEKWKNSRGKVFLAVAFTEGQDWKGEICDAQILLKVPYPDAKEDARVRRRLEKCEWTWYRLEALKETIQAYGRAVRSPEEKKKFYVIDSSFPNLISWAWKWVPQWFKDALPPHWNKDVIYETIKELKQLRRETGVYRGYSDSQLKKQAVKILRGEL